MDTTICSLGPCQFSSPLKLSSLPGDGVGDFVPDRVRVRYQVEFGGDDDLPDITFEKAGPRRNIYFDPAQTRAAIVTCGGICPGLNNVIRSVFLELHHNYGVKEVLGLRYGYAGLNPATAQEPLRLTSDLVDRIHEHGGSVLGSSRGPQPPEVMLDYLVSRGVNILMCVGGDGTLRGAKSIADAAIARKANMVVVGVPKTIDNDVMYVSRTFGVNTAIQRAAEILECAHVESKSALNGVGLVKVMGRESGFIAAGATLASQEVNFCLIPEQAFTLDGPKGFLKALEVRLALRQHAVVVVAEGAGQDLVSVTGIDKSGNKRLADIGVHLKEQILAYFKGINMPAEVKYFDPSYYIRSVRANSNDAILCDQYARHAVHAAMAGKTNLVIGLVGDSFTHLPISLATCQRKQVDVEGQLWRGVIACTGQPAKWG